jgi:VanZ family protein
MTWIKINRKILLFSFISVIISISVLSLLPPKSSLHLGSKDKISHFLAYFILSSNAFLVWRISRKSFWLIFILILYGLLLEFFQNFVPGRDSNWLDAFANTTGVLLGFLIIWLFSRIDK